MTEDLVREWQQSMRSCIVMLIHVKKGQNLNNTLEVAHILRGWAKFSFLMGSAEYFWFRSTPTNTHVPNLSTENNWISFSNRCPMRLLGMVTMEEQERWQRLSHHQVRVFPVPYANYMSIYQLCQYALRFTVTPSGELTVYASRSSVRWFGCTENIFVFPSPPGSKQPHIVKRRPSVLPLCQGLV